MPPRLYTVTQVIERQITAPDSCWNRTLAADAPETDESAAVQAQLVAEAVKAVPYLNATHYTSPVTIVDSSTPRVPVTLLRTDSNLTTLRLILAQGVPIPADWTATGDTDDEGCFYDPVTDQLWELWKLRKDANGAWTCKYGGRMSYVSTNPGHWVDRLNGVPKYKNILPSDPALAATFEDRSWGATATGLPLAAGILTREDVDRGYADHALGLAVINARPGTRAPAQRNDGNLSTAAVQEGMILRLPADYVPAMADPIGRIIATAVRDHGLIVWDRAGSLSVRAEPAVTQSPLWTHGYDVLKGLPWGQIRVLAV